MGKRTKKVQAPVSTVEDTNNTPVETTEPVQAPAEPTEAPVEMTEEQVQEVRTRLALLRAEVAQLEGTLATYQQHTLVTSTVSKPVAMVKAIFLGMLGERRRDVIRKCVVAGIAENTAKTQYQLLKKKLENGELAEEIEALQAAAEDN